MRISYKVSLGGVIAALSLALMLLTSVMPFGMYAFPCFAGILLTVVVIEAGYAYAFGVYAAVSALSMLLTADKEAALLYILFLGCYPIIKSFIERLASRALQFALKLIMFNLCMVAEFFLATRLMSVPAESYYILGAGTPILLLIFANVVFIVYDLSVTRLVTVYMLKWHKKFNKNTKL